MNQKDDLPSVTTVQSARGDLEESIPACAEANKTHIYVDPPNPTSSGVAPPFIPWKTLGEATTSGRGIRTVVSDGNATRVLKIPALKIAKVEDWLTRKAAHSYARSTGRACTSDDEAK